MSNPVEKLYKGKCTVTEYQDVKDPITKVTRKQEVVVLTEQPCRLSFSSAPAASVDDAPAITQSIKLFISPSVEIKPGSKVTVTQNNVTTEYSRSGFPAVYSTHQEIVLDLFKGWA